MVNPSVNTASFQILGLILGYLASSLVEYMLHKEYLHRNDNMGHMTVHHKNYHGLNGYEQPGSAWSDIASSPAYIISNILLYTPLAILAYNVSLPFGSAFATTAVAYTLWVELVHFWYHAPLKTFIEKTKFFKNINEHHRQHHIIYNENYGIGSTFWDIVLGTKK